MSAASDRYQARVRELGCLICRVMSCPPPRTIEIHHVESVRDEASEFAVVPLCHEHHEGANGVHGLSRRGFEMRYKLSPLDMLAMVTMLLESP